MFRLHCDKGFGLGCVHVVLLLDRCAGMGAGGEPSGRCKLYFVMSHAQYNLYACRVGSSRVILGKPHIVSVIPHACTL